MRIVASTCACCGRFRSGWRRRLLRGAEAEPDVALTHIGLLAVISIERPDEEIVDAIDVHVTGRADHGASLVVLVYSGRDEAVAAVAASSRQQRHEGILHREVTGLPEHDVALSGEGSPARNGVFRADDEIGDAVSVDVACGARRAR